MSISELSKIVSNLSTIVKTLGEKVIRQSAELNQLKEKISTLELQSSLNSLSSTPVSSNTIVLSSSSKPYRPPVRPRQFGPIQHFPRDQACNHGSGCRNRETCRFFHSEDEKGTMRTVDKTCQHPCKKLAGNGTCDTQDCWAAHKPEDLKIETCMHGLGCRRRLEKEEKKRCKLLHGESKQEYFDEYLSKLEPRSSKAEAPSSPSVKVDKESKSSASKETKSEKVEKVKEVDKSDDEEVEEPVVLIKKPKSKVTKKKAETDEE